MFRCMALVPFFLGAAPKSCLVGRFNPFEKYQSNRIISPGRGGNKKSLKPPASCVFCGSESKKTPETDHQKNPCLCGF